jgi:HAD superfamily hydrolase (TIGR01509 family)
MDYIHSRYNIGKTGSELLHKANEIINDFYSNEVMLKDGVAEFLEYCKAKGIKMCIASASDMEFLKIAAKRCDIEKYFVDIISCVDVGKGKEEPDIYLKAMEILGTTADETCIFEDSHVAICTADKLGIRTVGIYDKYNYGQEEIKKTSTVYIAQGDTLKSLIV